MKTLSYLLPFVLLLVVGCREEVCRECPGITFDYESFDPTVNDDAFVFSRADGSTLTFERIRFNRTEGQEVCTEDVDEPADIICDGFADLQLGSEELGIDMAINYYQILGQRGVPTQTVQSFSFRDRDFTQFLRTHAVVIEPEIVLQGSFVELRDSLTIDGELYLDVLRLNQPASAFDQLTSLPDAGRFTVIEFKEGVGLLRLVDVDGNVYERRFQ